MPLTAVEADQVITAFATPEDVTLVRHRLAAHVDEKQLGIRNRRCLLHARPYRHFDNVLLTPHKGIVIQPLLKGGRS